VVLVIDVKVEAGGGGEGWRSVLFFLDPAGGLTPFAIILFEGDGDGRRITGAMERWRSVTPSLFSFLSSALP
jgi:hypothetical protein